ncbi:MAG: lipid-A-disaccharide synthase-related protein [Brevinematia bacterium]
MLEGKTFLFVSNCYGEDIAASLIARSLVEIATEKSLELDVYGASLISSGEEYTKRGIRLVFSSSLPPSGGFPTKSISGFFADFFSGSLFNIFSFLKRLEELKGEIDIIFVVGDVFLLYLVRKIFKKEMVIFFALAKSDYFMPHYRIEKKYIKKNADLVFARDSLTAENLREYGINAFYLGNPLIDCLDPEGLRLDLPLDKKVIGILPGSRKESYKNFLLILNLIKKIERKDLIFVAAFPKTLDERYLKNCLINAGYSYVDSTPFPEIIIKENKVIITKGYFVDVVDMSTILIGLAGTANEQAAGRGKPVISFRGCGPQTTPQRMKEQERLMGGAIKFVRDYPDGVIREILFLLENEKERERRGKIGRERMGELGAAKKIAEFLFSLKKALV